VAAARPDLRRPSGHPVQGRARQHLAVRQAPRENRLCRNSSQVPRTLLNRDPAAARSSVLRRSGDQARPAVLATEPRWQKSFLGPLPSIAFARFLDLQVSYAHGQLQFEAKHRLSRAASWLPKTRLSRQASSYLDRRKQSRTQYNRLSSTPLTACRVLCTPRGSHRPPPAPSMGRLVPFSMSGKVVIVVVSHFISSKGSTTPGPYSASDLLATIIITVFLPPYVDLG